MLSSEARILTAKAGRYLGQVCKHFAHKHPVTLTPPHGRVELGAGACVLEAEPDSLMLRAEAKDEESLVRLERVVVSHLQRFAFREPIEVRWTRIG